MIEKLNFDTKKEEVWKGLEFWQEEIEQAGLKGKLRFFNDVITEKTPPHPDTGYRDPI